MKFNDLEMAFHFINSGQPMENRAFVDRETGAVYYHSEIDTIDEELPDDIESDRYLEVPHRNDLDLGRQLVLSFVNETLPDDYDAVRSFFSQPGAYARFKDLLHFRGRLTDWHEYETRKCEQALREWCRENGLNVDG